MLMESFVNSKSIAIMLSIYNGEKYLCQLIDSILKQTCSDYTLYIRDDGSTDKSLEIIQHYVENSRNIVLFPKEKNKGVNGSFLYMLANIESQYYMYCDQDDIWKHDKVEITLEVMKRTEKENPNMPIIVHTDLTLVRTDLSVIDNSFWHYLHHNPSLPHEFNYYCHYVDVTGCTMMFNSIVKGICKGIENVKIPSFLFYDRLISLYVSRANGLIIPVNKTTVIYRRHEGTTTNPMGSLKSILYHPWDSINYMRRLKSEYEFYKNMGYGSFTKFLYYRIRLVNIRRKLALEVVV